MSAPAFSLAGFAAVGIGAVLGAWGRWALGLWLNTADRVMPWGTLVANLAGGLLIGMAVAWFARHPDLDPSWRLFAVTGFLGALTTFSSFSVESLGMIQRGAFGLALAHTGLHLFGSLAAAAVGYRLAS
ncbi:fluoride efflux transporter CrcB [Burkholderiaceae bacterium FT117]|uniref:fluoride efflux transporter CrcB n=1 Tax=Zeimonas sediminis TaxID=2944268 RepID=UPI0023432036|nr:fluoride efflux transporter CrcB [Zeimonas sediminis]MCM5572106.1 fluoride efflux transporter CrcB [Zeimonas sediminis]